VARGDAIAASQWEGPSSDTLPFDRLRSHEVYMDTAWMDRGSMRNAIEWLGPDRVLFGTDGSPHPGSIDYFKRQLADMGLPDAQRQAIEHTNAARLFGFQS